MSHKRKRSVNDSPLSISSYGAMSTPEALSPTPFPHSINGLMDVDLTTTRHNGWDFASANRIKRGDWGNRTRKRVRDNRPDERSIHENTLQKLFSAQRQHPNASPMPSDQQSHEHIAMIQKPQRSTLHSFWKQLPAPPVQAPIFAMPATNQPSVPNQACCEDCDAQLDKVNDSMDIDMDMDMDMGGAVEGNPFACSDCGKKVCGTCAIMSTRRHCLQCATNGRNSRRWW